MVARSSPTGSNFDEIYIVLCNFRSDRNALDFLILKNPNANDTKINMSLPSQCERALRINVIGTFWWATMRELT